MISSDIQNSQGLGNLNHTSSNDNCLLLGEDFTISRIIEVEVRVWVISRRRRLHYFLSSLLCIERKKIWKFRFFLHWRQAKHSERNGVSYFFIHLRMLWFCFCDLQCWLSIRNLLFIFFQNFGSFKLFTSYCLVSLSPVWYRPVPNLALVWQSVAFTEPRQ